MPKPRRAAAYSTCRRWTAAEARAALAAHAASGLSVRAFALNEGLDPQRLLRWRHRLDGAALAAAAPLRFVEVRPRPAVDPIEIVLRSGHVLRVAESVDVTVVARLVEALDR